MILQSAPNAAAVYGLVVPASQGVTPVVKVTIMTSSGGSPVTVQASVANDQAGGTHCDALCYAKGLQCNVGDVSAGGPTSCPYGCLFAQSTKSYSDCAAQCDTFSCGSHYDGTLLSCGGCATDAPVGKDECKVGCSIVHNATAGAAMSWKALLPPQAAGGEEYSIVIECTSGCTPADAGFQLRLDRVAFGEVFFCAGQSNAVLNLQQTYEYKDKLLERQVAAGMYSNIRIYNFNGGIYPAPYRSTPAYATTWASLDTLGGAWLNSSYAAQINDDAVNFPPHNVFRTFSAACWYTAQKLTDLLGDAAPPIGLVLASMGGTSIESWSANETVSSCIETNPGSSGAEVSKLFYGSISPFVNMTITGWIW